MRTINEIIVHCSDTESGKAFTAADIRRWHVEGNGWKDIGYHYVIRLDGTIEAGRPLEQVGAHCSGRNANSIGVCYIGGRADGKAADTRTIEQRVALVTLIRSLKVCFPTINKVSGHRDYANKACPCFDAAKEYGFIFSENRV